MSLQPIKDQIRCELANLEDLTAAESLADDEALEGVLDSISMLELVAGLEDHYSLRIGENEMCWENFSSIDNIADFLVSKGVTGSSPKTPK